MDPPKISRKEKKAIKEFLAECHQYRKDRLLGSNITAFFQKKGMESTGLTICFRDVSYKMPYPFISVFTIEKDGFEVSVNALRNTTEFTKNGESE